jgi:glycerol-3-phosphate dehydrogenase (NAD(P)+)
MSNSPPKAAIVGAGSWGTALAVHLARSGRDVHLWGRDDALIRELVARRANPTYLPDVGIPAAVTPTSSLGEALARAQCVIVAVPSHGLRAVMREAAALIPHDAVIVSATKGLEPETHLRMSEVIRAEVADRQVVVLSGPSFAAEVARGLPAALVVAAPDTEREAVAAVQQDLGGSSIRLYASDDVIGVELGAALKNVIAIAAGAVEALELGHNALAALITRGLVEISRLAGAMGARRETIGGLSGLGDLVLTCTGTLSRNRHVGIELGRGRSLSSILAGMRMVAEGVTTTSAVLALGQEHGVELPIAVQMADVMAGRRSPREAVGCLMLRPQRGERDGH